MTCREHQFQLSAYLDDRLDEGARAAFEAEILSCAECQQTLRLLAGAARVLASEPPAAPPPGLAERAARAAVAAERDRRAGGWLDGWLSVAWPTAAVTAAAAVLMLLLAGSAPRAPIAADRADDPLGVLSADGASDDPLTDELLALEVEP